MNINILRYSLFGIAGGQEVDHCKILQPGLVSNMKFVFDSNFI